MVYRKLRQHIGGLWIIDHGVTDGHDDLFCACHRHLQHDNMCTGYRHRNPQQHGYSLNPTNTLHQYGTFAEYDAYDNRSNRHRRSNGLANWRDCYLGFEYDYHQRYTYCCRYIQLLDPLDRWLRCGECNRHDYGYPQQHGYCLNPADTLRQHGIVAEYDTHDNRCDRHRRSNGFACRCDRSLGFEYNHHQRYANSSRYV